MKLKVCPKNFKYWFILIKYFRLLPNRNQIDMKLFYNTYYDCWITEQTDEHIMELTLDLIKSSKVKDFFETKKYFWENSPEHERYLQNGEAWIWMWNEIQNMFNQEPSDLQKSLFKLRKHEIESSLEWNGELFDDDELLGSSWNH